MTVRDPQGRPLDLEPGEPGGAMRLVHRRPPVRPAAPPAPTTAPAPVAAPVRAAAPAAAPADSALARDYMGRVVQVDEDVSTDDELSAALAALADGTGPHAAALDVRLRAASGTWAADPASPLRTELGKAFVRQGAVLTNPDGLMKWWVALGKRQSNPVNVVVSGNSKREGTGATNYADRFPLALQDRLRQQFQPAGVVGAAVPNVHLAGMSPLPANLPYTIGGSAAGSQYGFGGRGFKAISGTTITIPFTGTRAKIRYYRASGAGILNIVLDGAAPVTVDSWVSGASSFAVWDTGALARGAHTLVVTRDAATTAGRDVFLGDVEIFDGDEAKGIRVYDASRHGVTANGLYTSLTGWIAGGGEFAAIGGWGLLVLGLGENDTALTAAQYKTEILGVINLFRTNGFASSVLLIHDAKPGNVVDSALWDAFGQVEREIALADPAVAHLDLSSIVPDYDVTNALGVYSDDRHNTSGGQGWEADLVASVLMPR